MHVASDPYLTIDRVLWGSSLGWLWRPGARCCTTACTTAHPRAQRLRRAWFAVALPRTFSFSGCTSPSDVLGLSFEETVEFDPSIEQPPADLRCAKQHAVAVSPERCVRIIDLNRVQPEVTNRLGFRQ